jgi:hypothetical protein
LNAGTRSIDKDDRIVPQAFTMQKKIKLAPDSYNLARKLFEAGADKRRIPVRPEWRGPALNDLVNIKRIARRHDAGKGKNGAPGAISLEIKSFDLLEEKAPSVSRAPVARQPLNGEAHTARRTVSLEALETFIANFKAQVAERSGDRERQVDAQITAAKQAVVAAKTPDEDNNAHVMLGNALRAKQQLQKSVRQEVLKSMRADDVSSHLLPIYDAMIDPGA